MPMPRGMTSKQQSWYILAGAAFLRWDVNREIEPKMMRTHIREKTLNFCIACHEESSSQQLQLTNQ